MRTGANIIGGPRVYQGMQDAATALAEGLAGTTRDPETNEDDMLAGWTYSESRRSGACRLAVQPANLRPGDSLRL